MPESVKACDNGVLIVKYEVDKQVHATAYPPGSDIPEEFVEANKLAQQIWTEDLINAFIADENIPL